ncbi:hypothetical protein PG984_015642 [Apiospora sp. TS-2023a]
MAPSSGTRLPLADRRPAYGIYFEAEPRYAKVSGIVVSVLASSACASFFCPSSPLQNPPFLSPGPPAQSVLARAAPISRCLRLILTTPTSTQQCSALPRSKAGGAWRGLTGAYLTAAFTFPIYRYTVKESAEISPTVASGNTRTRNERLLRVAKKSFAGCCLTLSSSIANLLALMLLDGEPAWLCLLCCKIDVLFNAVVLFWVTRTDSRDITTTASRSKSDSARSRVTRLSFYTSWIRANMGQGPHPGRPFIIPQDPPPAPASLPLMGDTTSSTTKAVDDRRAVIDTAATATVATVAESSSSQTSKAPTKSILRPASPTANANIDAAAARFGDECGNEIWTGPGHVEAAELTMGLRMKEKEAEEKPDPSEKSYSTEATGMAGTDDGGAK